MTIFTEGPIILNKETGELEMNPNSFNKIFNVVYVDQPIGTSFSIKNDKDAYSKTELEVSDFLYKWLTGFLKAHPNFQGRDFYIAGESYSGQFIPFLGKKILDRYSDPKSASDPKINLKGVMIGNGWSNPTIQYRAYNEFAVINDLITIERYNELKPLFDACYTFCNKNFSEAYSFCEKLSNLIFKDDSTGHYKFNIYDIRKQCDMTVPGCYDLSHILNFMSQNTVEKSLGVHSTKENFNDCNNQITEIMDMNNWNVDASKHLKYLLENKVNVVYYAGVEDFIVNWMGVENMLNSVEWDKRKEFNEKAYEKVEYGEAKCIGNLAFVKFDGAGHMVPMDQPEMSLIMYRDILQGKYRGC